MTGGPASGRPQGSMLGQAPWCIQRWMWRLGGPYDDPCDDSLMSDVPEAMRTNGCVATVRVTAAKTPISAAAIQRRGAARQQGVMRQDTYIIGKEQASTRCVSLPHQVCLIRRECRQAGKPLFESANVLALHIASGGIMVVVYVKRTVSVHMYVQGHGDQVRAARPCMHGGPYTHR